MTTLSVKLQLLFIVECKDNNEHYGPCGHPCNESCAFAAGTTSCTAQSGCTKGCFCREGYKRDAVSKKCVKIIDCPGEQNKLIQLFETIT